jgi:hypothetical protein
MMAFIDEYSTEIAFFIYCESRKSSELTDPQTLLKFVLKRRAETQQCEFSNYGFD